MNQNNSSGNNNSSVSGCRPGYAPVIGETNVYVKLGSKDEYLYWRVIDTTNPGCGKKFYSSPMHVPNFNEWGDDPVWKEQIRDWEIRRNNYLNFIVL